MASISKQLLRKHEQAMDLLKQDFLSWEERLQVLEDFHPGVFDQKNLAAFFTPLELGFAFAIELSFERAKSFKVLDLCAGIGCLSATAAHFHRQNNTDIEFTCVEINPDYVEIGKKVLPEATWICGDATDPDLLASLGHFDYVISNPPFGRVSSLKHKTGPYYTGGESEFKIIDCAADLARAGIFILPQQSAPFRYTGEQCYREEKTRKYQKFAEQTGLELEIGLAQDLEQFETQWKGAFPRVEIVISELVRDDRILMQSGRTQELLFA